jgi:hypothetical protein
MIRENGTNSARSGNSTLVSKEERRMKFQGNFIFMLIASVLRHLAEPYLWRIHTIGP